MNKDQTRLRFASGNAKLDAGIATFSLPAGFTCPGALKCLSKCVLKPEGLRIEDGPNCEYRCFSASEEVIYSGAREMRWNNFNILKSCKKVEAMVTELESALPTSQFNLPVRSGVSGDYFNQTYFDAWMEVARNHPKRTFYSYTKSLSFWLKRLNSIPSNFQLTASYGGKWDAMIKEFNLRSAQVVYSVDEANQLGLEIDHDDSHAYNEGPDFALLIHGTQPKGTPAAKAWQKIKTTIGGYSKGKDWGVALATA